LHIVPSGIFFPNVECFIGAGTLISCRSLVKEIEELEASGVSTARLHLSNRAHIVLPFHLLLEEINEEFRKTGKLGTTRQGIGPGYASTFARWGIRFCDLQELGYARNIVQTVVERYNHVLSAFDHPPIDWKNVFEELMQYVSRLYPYLCDTESLLSEYLESGKRVLLEGQLGVMRDIDWGMYPYVTSSFPCPGGILQGAGVSPRYVTAIIAVVKTYSTAVGGGPMVAELKGEEAERLRTLGREFGATTGRPRRCGWLDLVTLRHLKVTSAPTQLALTKIDVLSNYDAIPVCVAYDKSGKQSDTMLHTHELEGAKPVLKQFQGWGHVSDWRNASPAQTKAIGHYVKAIEVAAGASVTIMSYGPERDATQVIGSLGLWG
ncbi:MAG: adenylosuccinate synthetase, partial [Blastocatellia bacterium]